MAVQFLHERTGQEGTYRLYRVSPLQGAQGGQPQYRAPFQPGSPAARALAEVQAAGYGMGFAVDVGNNNGDVYVMAAPGQPNLNPPVQPAPPTTTPRQPTTQPTYGAPNPAIGGQGPSPTGNYVDGANWKQVVDLIGSLLKYVTNVKAWARQTANSPPSQVYNFAKNQEKDLVAVGGLLQGIPGMTGVNWMGRRKDGNWFIPVVLKGGIFTSWLPGGGAPDIVITSRAAAFLIDPQRVYPAGHEPALIGDGDDYGDDRTYVPRTETGEVPYGAVGELIGVPPTRPREIMVRRCGKGMRLAIDGACYPKGLLRAATRMNTPKRAPVSWRKAKYISEGRKAEKAIQKYAENHDIPLEGEHRHRHEHRRRHEHEHRHE